MPAGKRSRRLDSVKTGTEGVDISSGKFPIEEVERRIDPADRHAYSFHDLVYYYTKERGWYTYQVREYWNGLRPASASFLV